MLPSEPDLEHVWTRTIIELTPLHIDGVHNEVRLPVNRVNAIFCNLLVLLRFRQFALTRDMNLTPL
jgi:hypothetical protein